MATTNGNIAAIERSLTRGLDALRKEADPRRQADAAVRVVEVLRGAIEDYSDVRTTAFVRFREEQGYSLSDLQREFGISRARAAQIATKGRQ